MALATPNQLYRLNKLGRLSVAPDSPALSHVDADLAIKQAEGTCCGDPADCVCGSGDAVDAVRAGTQAALTEL